MDILELRKRLEKLYKRCTDTTIEIDTLFSLQKDIIKDIRRIKLDIEQEEDKRIINRISPVENKKQIKRIVEGREYTLNRINT